MKNKLKSFGYQSPVINPGSCKLRTKPQVWGDFSTYGFSIVAFRPYGET